MSKLYIRGLMSNSLGLILLVSLSTYLNLQKEALVSVGIQYTVFLLHGLPNRSEKFYDLSGSATHLSVVMFSLLSSPSYSIRQIINTILVIMWLTRLGNYLFARILSDGKDTRFDRIKTNWLAFLGAWTLQACWVFLVDLPAVLLNHSDNQPHICILDAIGWWLWIVGFIFEALADAQKMAFRSNISNKGQFIQEGLWRYSRHPNYFGEILMWIALCVSGHSSINSIKSPHMLQWISPLFTIFLLKCVSGVPMLEKIGFKKWGKDPKYLNYIKNTNCIIPGAPAKMKN